MKFSNDFNTDISIKQLNIESRRFVQNCRVQSYDIPSHIADKPEN